MAKIIFLTDQFSSRLDLSSSDTAAGLDISNLLDIHPGVLWRSVDVSSIRFDGFAIGSSANIDMFALLYTNRSAAAQWRIVGWTPPSNYASPDLDSGVVNMFPTLGVDESDSKHAIYRHPSLVEVTHIDIEIFDPGNTDGYFRAGVLMCGTAFQPERNFGESAGFGFGHVDESELVENLNGGVSVVERPSYQVGQFSMNDQAASDAHQFRELARLYGGKRPVFISFDHTGDWIDYPLDSMTYAQLQFSSAPVVNSRTHRRWNVPISFREFV